jgi:lipopolysaccharide biosynthesis protein
MQSKFAVVIHLFYTENWPLFKRKLLLLPDGSFDLFLTMPKENMEFLKTVQEDFPGATAVQVKNRGRDVLPFITIARRLYKDGYGSVLKFHSKKSTHRDDGQEWLELMLDQIIPENKRARAQILDIIRGDRYGVIGPASMYYPLTINFPANGAHMTRIVSELYGKKRAHETLQVRRKEFGFFGGTMFWVNLDSIKGLLKLSRLRFEREKGQIDGTFAHALERLFCVVPEIEDKDIYESDGLRVTKRPYQSGNIPDWSEDHEK